MNSLNWLGRMSYFSSLAILSFIWQLESTPVPDFFDNGIFPGIQTCDPLRAEGTAVLCFPPSNVPNQDFGPSSDCSQPSIPRTVASYSCRNPRDVVFTGFLSCSVSGVWITSLERANSSLCNLDSTIVNFAVPDVVIATELPEFTTPTPNRGLLQMDVSFLSGYEAVGLQLHNTFRRNHGVPSVQMTEQLNTIAQQLAESIASGQDIRDVETDLLVSPFQSTKNLEMNWYFQVPVSPNSEEAVSNAVQSWYSGFFKYDWENVGRNFEIGDALAFARVVWRSTLLIGCGVSNSNTATFVVCLYTPGRNVLVTDPIREFQANVQTVRVG